MTLNLLIGNLTSNNYTGGQNVCHMPFYIFERSENTGKTVTLCNITI